MDNKVTSCASSMNPHPMDCKRGVTDCRDYECECRHLDPIEQQLCGSQTLSSPLQKKQPPKCIVTASRDMGRTASTWVFNAVRLLYRQAHQACDSYWIRQLTAEKLKTRLQAAAQRTEQESSAVLIKTHEFTDYMTSNTFQKEIAPLVTHVIVSIRQGLQFPPYPDWMNQATLVVKYEDIVQENPTQDMNQGSLKVLREIANHLGLSPLLEEDDYREVDYQLMTLPIPGDQSTKFWSFHARRGGRSRPPKPNSSNADGAASNRETAISSTTPTKQTIFVTRHGARSDNGPDRDPQWLSKVPHNRPGDCPLSPLGRQEAKELADELYRRCHESGGEKQVDMVIVSSPYIRCLETAHAIANKFNVSIKVEPGIAEVGSTASSVGTNEELMTNYAFSGCIDRDYVPVMTRQQLPQREWGDGAAARRARRVAQTIAKNHHWQNSNNNAPSACCMVFVGHGGSCLGLVSAFGAPEEYIGYCSVTEFEYSPGKQQWKMVGELGTVTHLSDPQVSLDSAW